MATRAKASGDDLLGVLNDVLQDLLGDTVKVHVDGLDEAPDVSDVSITVSATVEDDSSDDGGDDDTTSRDSAGDDKARPASQEDAEDEPSLDDEAEAAADFVEGILDSLDLPGELKIRIDDALDEAEIEVVDVDGGVLIGRRGQTLEAVQELLRSAMQREFQRRSRVRVDVEGYRARRLEKLLDKAEEAIDIVRDTGESQRLEPMDVFERKAVHRLVGEFDGITSRSQGREPGRRIVIEAE